MPKIFNQAPNVETELGRELRDICAIGVYVGMSEKQIHAAILGRTGVCSTSWGDPWERSEAARNSCQESISAKEKASV